MLKDHVDQLPDQPPKAWRVLRMIKPEELEDELNRLATEDMQVFRIDRYTDPRSSGYGPDQPFYDVIAMNPTLIAQRQTASMMNVLGQAGFPFGPGGFVPPGRPGGT
jgi:hypothetical protein